MPYPSTYPTLFDEALQLSITKLKEWGYLHPDQRTKAIINWGEAASVSININTSDKQPYIELKYKYNNKTRKYKVKLVAMPSNLGKGFYYYFICPITGKRCRKLYLINGIFGHRSAFTGMYNIQTQSRKSRQIHKTLGTVFNIDKLIEELNKKGFTKYYKGKPTKKYLRIMEQIQEAENIPYHEIEKLILS